MRTQAQHDYEQEQIEQEQREAHDEGQCDGEPKCGYCLDAIADAKREEQARRDRRERMDLWLWLNSGSPMARMRKKADER